MRISNLDQMQKRRLAFQVAIGETHARLYEDHNVPKYDLSWDAVMPLVQALDSMQFIRLICFLLPEEKGFENIHTVSKARALYFATPSKLLDGFLVATGKAEE